MFRVQGLRPFIAPLTAGSGRLSAWSRWTRGANGSKRATPGRCKMRLQVWLAIITAVNVHLAPAVASQAVDFSSCASALDDVSSAADDAASKARDAESAEDEYQTTKDEYETCRRFPEIYDLFQDGCRSKLRDAKNAQDDLESATGDLVSALDDLDNAIDDVQSVCGHTFVPATAVSGVSSERQSLCTKIRRLRATLKPQDLVELCRRFMSETECGACLSAP